MSFVLNPNPLGLDPTLKKIEGVQYYEWKYKQRLQQQEEERKRLLKLLENIEKEQEEQKRQNQIKKRMYNNESFYDKSQKWKKNVDKRIQLEKKEKLKQIQTKQENQKKTQVKQDKKEFKNHQGPITGWQEHFQNYLKNKTIGLTIIPQQATFEPKINQKSKKITQGIQGPVEDRLILFGQFLKMKIKTEQIQQKKAQNSIYSFSNIKSNQKYFSNSSAQSNLFYRLYKEGQQANKKRRQMTLDDRHTFQPKLNKLSEENQDKIMKRRKPLYYLKNSTSLNQNQAKDNQNESTQRTAKSDFEGFMKRNQALIEMKRNMVKTMKQKIQEKQNMERSKCTFSPVLNKKSLKMQKSIKQNHQQLSEKILNQIKSQISNFHPPNHPENIDISKLTISQMRQVSYYDDTDSLSGYKIYEERPKPNIKNIQFETKNRQLNKEEASMKNQYSKFEDPVPTSLELTQKNGQQDSIQKMKSNQWEEQLQLIESHLQNMMSRVNR